MGPPPRPRLASPGGCVAVAAPLDELGQEMGSALWRVPAKWMPAKGLRERQRDRAQGHLMGEDIVRTE